MKNLDNKFWTIERKMTYSPYDRYETIEEAQSAARAKAWEEAVDVFIMSQVAVAKAPEQINSVKIDAVN